MKSVNTTLEDAYKKLYAQYRQKALVYASFYCNGIMIAEDIVQDVFMKIWEKKELLNSIDNWNGYLFVMVRSIAFTCLKRDQREKGHKNQYGQERSSQYSTHLQLEEKEQQKTLNQAIAKLSPKQQLVLRLHCQYNWKQIKIAKTLKLAPSSVKTHMKMAKRNVEKYIREKMVA